MRHYNTLTIRHAQDNQPWVVPYSDNFMSAIRYTGPSGGYLMPHLMGSHITLHAAKTVGQISAVFEALDHNSTVISAEQVGILCDKAADLMTAAMRLANLYKFDLTFALVERSEDKNGVKLSWPGEHGPICPSDGGPANDEDGGQLPIYGNE
jgi:hypothetical protein